MKFAIFSLFSFLVGIIIGFYYLMNKKEKAQYWNRKTRVLLVSAIATSFVLFVIAATMSAISFKIF
jgi:membrane-associated HD superfamily phosphohydrolase